MHRLAITMSAFVLSVNHWNWFDVCVRQQIIVSYPPTKQLSSEEQDLVWKFRYYLTTQEKVGVFMFCSAVPHPQRFKRCIQSCTYSLLPSPPRLAAGPDKVPQVCELGSATGGQAGPGAAGQVEADGCGGLPGAAVLPVHQPYSQTLRCGTTATGRRWGRRRRTEEGSGGVFICVGVCKTCSKVFSVH